MATLFSSLSPVSSLGSLRSSVRAYLLSGSLLAGACGGHSHSETNPVQPTPPVPLQTVASTNMAAGTDGCLYGTSAYSLTRPTTVGDWVVSMQTACPANYFIEADCRPTLRYGASRVRGNPYLASVCFDPSVSTDQGLDPCQVGAFVCAAVAPGDQTTSSTSEGSDGQQVTSSDTTPGADGVDLEIRLRCCPSR